MALSGSFYKAIGSYWRLRIDWSATQNVSANTSTVKANCYFQSIHSSAAVYSTASKDYTININGNKKTGTAVIGVNGNASKLIGSHTVTVPHNSDGTKSITIACGCDIAVTLSGTYYGYQEASSTVTLNTIPRASTFSSSANISAFTSFSFSLGVASSSFKHTVNFYVNDTWIKRVEGVKTSSSFTFTTSELTTMATALAQSHTGTSKFTVTTYNGSSTVGTTTKTGTITAPNNSTWSIKSFYYMGDTISGTLKRYNNYVDCDIGIFTTDGSTKIAAIASDTKNSTVSFSLSSIASTLYSKMGSTSIYYDAIIKVHTNYNNVQINSGPTSYKVRIYADDSNPVFNNSGISCYDSNSTTTNITGNNSLIIQNKSSLVIKISSSYKATAQNGATMSKYIIECSGKTKEVSYSTSDITVTIGSIDSSSNQTAKITAVDSRGLSTTVSKTISVIPYKAPTINLTAKRTNNFESETTITAKCSGSSITVSGTEKNAFTSITFKYKDSSSSSYTSLSSLTYEGTFPNRTFSKVANLDNSKSFTILAELKDNFSTVTKTVTLNTGKPLFYLNTSTNSVGINKQTTGSNRLEIEGSLNGSGNLYYSGYLQAGNYLKCGSGKTYTTSTSAYGLDMNNSDIINSNGIYFNDTSANGTMEGLNFPKSTMTTDTKTDASQYNCMYVLDDKIYLDGEVVFAKGKSGNLLKDVGGKYMHNEQSTTPSKTLKNCQNGWLLIWSGYDTSSSTVQNTQWNFQFIPKEGFSKIQEYGTSPLIACQMVWNGTPVRKLLYTNGVAITGHASNSSHVDAGYEYGFYDNRRLVLRWVYEY